MPSSSDAPFGMQVPQPWLEALRKVQEVVPEAILAGGCLRDLILGGAVKDLDIFVPVQSAAGDGMDSLDLIAHAAHAAGWVRRSRLRLEYADGSDPEVQAAVEYAPCQANLELPIQVIAVECAGGWSTFNAIRRMDFGACQIAVNGLGTYWTLPAHHDLVSRRITLMPGMSAARNSRSLRRADRFAKKYAGTDVVVDITSWGSADAAPKPTSAALEAFKL